MSIVITLRRVKRFITFLNVNNGQSAHRMHKVLFMRYVKYTLRDSISHLTLLAYLQTDITRRIECSSSEEIAKDLQSFLRKPSWDANMRHIAIAYVH